MQSTRRVRLFVHGVPNAGKTTWFAGLYGLRDRVAGEVLLTFNDAATNHYLRLRWRCLQEGIAPRATPVGKPETLRWNLRRGDETWAMTAIDYAGALIDTPTVALAAPVREQLAASDAILLLLDCAEPDVNQLDAVAALLETLQRDEERRGPPRPVALLLTKADRLGTTGPVNLRQQAVQRFRGHAAFRQIDRLLKESGKLPFPLEVFPVSLCGGSGPGGALPPTSHWQPFNLYEPLGWTIDAVRPLRERWQADVLDAARAEARRRLGTGTATLWPDFAGALRAYADIERTAHLSEGPHAERTAAEVRALQRGRWAWRRRAATAVAGAVLLLVLGAWRLGGVAAGWAFDDVEQFCEAHPGDEFAAERLQQRQALLGSTWARDDAWWLTTDRRRRAEDGIAGDRAALSRHAFAELVRRRDELPGDENAAARVRLVKGSDLRYHPRYEDLLSRFVREDEAVHARHRERTAHQELVASAPSLKAEGRFRELHRLCAAFLDEFPGSSQTGEVKTALADARQAWDAQAWEEARSAERRDPNDHREIRDRYRRCLEVPETAHAVEAAAAVERFERAWDRAEYARVRAADQPVTWQEAEDAASLARAYLDADRVVKAGREPVRAYLAWTQRLRLRQGRYAVKVESLTLPPNGPVLNGVAHLQLEVSGNGTKQTSDWFVPGAVPARDTFADLPVIWRDDPTVTVLLRDGSTEAEWKWDGRVASGRPGECLPKAETVMEVELNSEKRKPGGWVTKATGIRVRLRLSCRDAVAPALPPYPGPDA